MLNLFQNPHPLALAAAIVIIVRDYTGRRETIFDANENHVNFHEIAFKSPIEGRGWSQKQIRGGSFCEIPTDRKIKVCKIPGCFPNGPDACQMRSKEQFKQLPPYQHFALCFSLFRFIEFPKTNQQCKYRN